MVLFSDESPYELLHIPNRQNDRVWARKKESVAPHEKIIFPSKIHVWGMMSYNAISELHIIPKSCRVTAKYYIEEILKKCLKIVLRRKRKTGSVLVRRLLPNMSRCIFQQDGAPAHNAIKTQDWCKDNVDSFCEEGIWPGNSSDLNPIENLWAIIQSKLMKWK
ncbi:hypothetical protein LOD99_15485 [Oopsacas minuta]|uniref:Tc1-like transposase DDE domain-containing protein n=1 Tax=Oopsacas minuta TaxID=111878 RepID=A0AAV7KAY6_9METZ|nr:hypothetical protein LOD99_15485 [Oopsacas minuta]